MKWHFVLIAACLLVGCNPGGDGATPPAPVDASADASPEAPPATRAATSPELDAEPPPPDLSALHAAVSSVADDIEADCRAQLSAVPDADLLALQGSPEDRARVRVQAERIIAARLACKAN